VSGFERFPHHRGDVASQTARAFIGIRELLLRGKFPRGERISELPLVARLGMSRTPIRLALERLAHIGLLDVGATGGFTVREFTLVEVLDAIEVRGVLEGTAARLAAEPFPSAMIDLAKGTMLRRHLEQVNSLPFASPSAMVFPSSILPKSDETLAIALEHHRGIVDAIGNRQGTRAESLAREHAYIARRVLELALSDTDALSGVPGGPLINVSVR